MIVPNDDNDDDEENENDDDVEVFKPISYHLIRNRHRRVEGGGGANVHKNSTSVTNHLSLVSTASKTLPRRRRTKGALEHPSWPVRSH